MCVCVCVCVCVSSAHAAVFWQVSHNPLGERGGDFSKEVELCFCQKRRGQELLVLTLTSDSVTLQLLYITLHLFSLDKFFLFFQNQ